MRDEEETQQDDEAADVAPAGEAASASPDVTVADPDPDLVDAANEAEKPADEE